MPTYDYLCTDCGHEFEFYQSMKADPLTDCPACENGTVRRKIGLGAGIIFKGSGFYETDFKDRKGSKPSEGESGSKSEGKPENKSDTKSETKSGGDTPKNTSSSASSSTSAASSD